MIRERIQDIELRRAAEDDVAAIADAHRDSILGLGAQFYAPSIVNEWVGIVNPQLYREAIARGEVFFVASGTIGGCRMILGFSSDYQIYGSTHGTSAYVRPVAARRRIGSRLLALAESFGRSRGATAIEIDASLGAVEFYKAHGFVETARGVVVLPSGLQMPCVSMRKQLIACLRAMDAGGT